MKSNTNTMLDITLENILSAQKRIAPYTCITPLKPSMTLSKSSGRDVRLKLENMQDTGSFKIRGATNKILSLPAEKSASGIITMSSGNHGKSVAWVAKNLGLKAIVCVTTQVPAVKIEGIEALGAEVIVCGTNQNEATDYAITLAEEKAMTYISPFDDPEIIAGQGTIALEIIKEWPEVDTMIVPLSGGGLMSGIALAAHYLKPEIKIIGVTIEHGAAMYESIRQGHLVDVEEVPSIADALQGPLPKDTRYTFPICRDYVDEIFQIPDEKIEGAMFHAIKHERLILEGGGAIPIALLRDSEMLPSIGQNIAAICSGDNVDFELIMKIARRYSCND